MQTKKQSIIESATQNVIGYVVGIGTQYIVFPLFDLELNLTQNLIIGFIFAIVSTARSYILRRLFNKQHLPKDMVTVNKALLASNEQYKELIHELQEKSIEQNELLTDMFKYIKKIDGIY